MFNQHQLSRIELEARSICKSLRPTSYDDVVRKINSILEEKLDTDNINVALVLHTYRSLKEIVERRIQDKTAFDTELFLEDVKSALLEMALWYNTNKMHERL